MTDLKFELLSILYNDPLHEETRLNLQHRFPDPEWRTEDTLRSLASEGLIKPLYGESSYKLTGKGFSAFEKEQSRKHEEDRRNRKADAQAAEERNDRAITRKMLILDLVLSAAALIVSIVALFRK